MRVTKLSHLFLKILQSLSTYLAYTGALSLFAMMCLTIMDVAGRYIFNKPVLGAYELTEFMILILIFSFLGYTQTKKSHISVDLFMMFFPEKLKVFIEIFNHLACLVIMILITWAGFDKAVEVMKAGEASPNLAVPNYPFVFFLVIGCAIMCIELTRGWGYKIFTFLFIFDGSRINRKQMWAFVIFGDIIIFIFGSLLNPDHILIYFIYLLLIYSFVVVSTKRWKDRNKSAFWVLLSFIPILNLWATIELLILKSVPESNT